MSVAEMKLKAINQITSLDSEVVLQQVLALLNDEKNTVAGSQNLSQNYNSIKTQYGDVLQKLAQ